MWPKGWTFVPGYDSPENADGETERAEYHGMQHGPMRSETRGNVTAQDTVERAVDRGEEQRPIVARHRRAQGGKDVGHVQDEVRAKRENNAHDHAGEYSDDASTNASLRALFADDLFAYRSFAHDLPAPFSMPAVPGEANSCARRS